MRLRRAVLPGLLAATGLLTAACGQGLLSQGGSGDDGGKGPITLGMVVPMTGPSAAIGPYMKHGAQLAVAEINSNGGVLGRELKVDFQDGACDPKTAVAAANKLVSAGVVGSVGGYCSGATLPTLPVFGKANIPMVIPAANSTDLIGYGHAFLINGTGQQQAQAALQWINQLGAQRVALINDNTSYSKDIADLTADLLKKPAGAKATTNYVITPGESDYSPAVTAVLNTNPDLIYFTGYYQEAGLLIRQLRQSGYGGDIMVGDGSVDQKLIEIAGAENAEGVHATMTQTPQTIPGAKGWISKYKKKFGSTPGPYSTQSYDAVRVMAHAIEMAGSTGGKDIIKALESINDFEIFSGQLNFTEKHTLSSGGFLILVVQNGEFTLESRLQ